VTAAGFGAIAGNFVDGAPGTFAVVERLARRLL
jgi:hypothetical protein